MSDHTVHLNTELKNRVVEAYISRFGEKPSILLRSPGRINLIGEHTDYNQGFVMPSAVSKGMYVAAGASKDCTHRWFAHDLDEYAEIGADGIGVLRDDWTDFVQGAWLSVKGRDPECPYLNLVIASDVPIGSGMSSSSALVCGVIQATARVADIALNPRDVPFMAYDVERGFIGVKGGIMDQYSSVLSEPGRFMLLDCRTNQHKYVNAPEGLHLFLVHSRVKRTLVGSEYNTRSDECASAVEYLQRFYEVKSLRDVSMTQLEAVSDEMDPVLLKRSRYVIEENLRVMKCKEALEQGRIEEVGNILVAGHAGLRDLFEVSIPELDFIVERAQAEPTICGARLMGGGFGGCAIHVAKAAPDKKYKDALREDYATRFGVEPLFIDVKLSGGTYIIEDARR